MVHVLLLATLFTTIPDGSLLFIERNKGIVAKISHSSVVHTAIVFNHQGTPWVYEAYPPRVRRMPLQDFIAFRQKKQKIDPSTRLWLLRPKKDYSPPEVANMLQFAVQQVARPYGVKSYLLDSSRRTIHCSEYTARILEQSGRYYSPHPWQILPKDLYLSTLPHHQPPEMVQIR
jgi:hypothetical protein